MGCRQSKEEERSSPINVSRTEQLLFREYDEFVETHVYDAHSDPSVKLTCEMTQDEQLTINKVVETIGLEAAEWYIGNTLKYENYNVCVDTFLVKRDRVVPDFTSPSNVEEPQVIGAPAELIVSASQSDTVLDEAFCLSSNTSIAVPAVSGGQLDHSNLEQKEESSPSSNRTPTTLQRALLHKDIEKTSVADLCRYFESLGRVRASGAHHHATHVTYMNASTYEKYVAARSRFVTKSPSSPSPLSAGALNESLLVHPTESSDSSPTNSLQVPTEDVKTGHSKLFEITGSTQTTSLSESEEHSPLLICRFTQRNLSSPFLCATHSSKCPTQYISHHNN